MPLTLDNTLANVPLIKRGFGYVIYSDDKKGARLTYPNKKSVFLRDLEDPSKSRVFSGEHKSNVTVAAASPNGEWIASGDEEGRLLIWGQSNYSVKSDFPMLKTINDIAWGPEGKRIVVAGNGQVMGACVSWDTGSALGTISGHTKPILSVDYKKTRPYRVVSSGEDFAVCHHEGPPFKLAKTCREHTNYVNKVKFSPDGEHFASVGSDKAINIYESKTAELVKSLSSKEGHTGSIYSFAWSPDSAKLLTCGADKTAKIWNVESGEVETAFTIADKPGVNDMQMCALWHGDHIITVSLSGALNFLDPASPEKPKNVVQGHASDITAVAVDVANQVFYSTDSTGVLCGWKDGVATCFTGKGHGKSIRAVALSNDGSKVVTVGMDDKLRYNDCKTMEFGDEAVELDGVPYCVTCAPKSNYAVVGTSKSELVLISGFNSSKFSVPEKPLSVAFSPDESKLAVGFEKNGVKVYDWNEGSPKLAYELKELKRGVRKVEWTPCGGFLLCSGDDRQVLVYSGEKQMNPTDWEYHTGAVWDHCVSPSGKRVASVSSDLSLIVWKDTAKWGTKRDTQKLAHREGIVKVAFLDEDTVLTVGADACMKVWKVED